MNHGFRQMPHFPSFFRVSRRNNVSNTCNLSLLIVMKIDTQTGKGLAGSVFRLSNRYGSSISMITDETGTAVFRIKQNERYLLKEIEAPQGYQKITGVYRIGVNQKGSIFINDRYTNVAIAPAYRNVPMAAFTTLKKNEYTGCPIVGAVYRLVYFDQTIATVKSDYFGRVHLYHLLPGEYLLYEVFVPQGINPRQMPYRININQTGDAFINGSSAQGYLLKCKEEEDDR